MGSEFWHPRYWIVWISLGVFRLLVLLPWKLQLKLGHAIGLLMFHALKKRRFISCVNIELAFPELNQQQRQLLVRKHFISLGKSIFEMPLAWWGSNRRLKRLKHIQGIEHLQAAIKQNKGIVLLSAHTTSLELGGRLLAQDYPLCTVYRPHQNKLLDKIITNIRTRQYGKTIPRSNMRDMIRSLKNGNMVWYAQDQKADNNKNRIFSPFFGVSTATNSALPKIVTLGDAIVVPFFAFRNNDGYQLTYLPAIEPLPSDNLEDDIAKINNIIEAQVRNYPDQYLWVHKRFRDHPDGSDRYMTYRPSKESCS